MLQFVDDLLIARDVRVNLCFPELPSGAGPFEKMAIMSVPETPVNKHNGVVPPEDNIWSPGKTRIMQSVSEATTIQPLPDEEFRLCIATTNAGHHPAPGRRVDNVSH